MATIMTQAQQDSDLARRISNCGFYEIKSLKVGLLGRLASKVALSTTCAGAQQLSQPGVIGQDCAYSWRSF